MNGGYIYGDSDMFGAIIDALTKAQRTATYKNAYYEAKRLVNSGKPIYFKHGDVIISVLSTSINGSSIIMYTLLDAITSLNFEPSTPDTITIN